MSPLQPTPSLWCCVCMCVCMCMCVQPHQGATPRLCRTPHASLGTEQRKAAQWPENPAAHHLHTPGIPVWTREGWNSCELRDYLAMQDKWRKKREAISSFIILNIPFTTAFLCLPAFFLSFSPQYRAHWWASSVLTLGEEGQLALRQASKPCVHSMASLKKKSPFLPPTTVVATDIRKDKFQGR